ncbi:stAR-related lipid transfer protein 9-like [Phocoena sinus]|uniref:stAR-related lipid transfer protein 9-like n=1 Tax=Phocoena sinus TaxID=42100 RepID=UPI0013C404EE|nr:stAR-related lipid transfer protein 9-like [Phocoena sinus]
MANVRVAVRVRPLSKRETKEGGRIIVEVDGKVAKIRNLKVDGRPVALATPGRRLWHLALITATGQSTQRTPSMHLRMW